MNCYAARTSSLRAETPARAVFMAWVLLAPCDAATVDGDAAALLLPLRDAVEEQLPAALHALRGNRSLRRRRRQGAGQERPADQSENQSGSGNEEAVLFHAVAPPEKHRGLSGLLSLF